MAIAQRSVCGEPRAFSAQATAPSITGTNSDSETSSVLITTSGGATAAMPSASTPTRRPQIWVAITPISTTVRVPSSVWTIRAAGGASSPATKYTAARNAG